MKSKVESTNGILHDEASLVELARSSALCDACRAIFSAHPDPEPQPCYFSKDSFVHHHAGGLEAAADNGCALCYYLAPAAGARDGGPRSTQWWMGRAVWDNDRWDESNKGINEDLFTLMICSSDGVGMKERSLTSHLGFVAAPYDKPIGASFYPKPESSKLADLVRCWVGNCQSQAHWQCAKYRSAHRLKPRRVLEISNTSLLLRDLSEIGLQGTYITLSHRWTTSEPPKLRRENADELFTVGVPLACLPRAFQDAAEICTWLGVKYLWIDSLCIYQDSAADWEREAGMMGDIYGGALINIAATDASTACEGIITRDRPRPLLPVVSSLGNPLLPERGTFVLHPTQAYGSQVTDTILLGRGWVHQELCVAPATLYMTATQAWWHCTTTMCNETYPEGMPSFIDKPNISNRLTLLPGATGEATTSDGADTMVSEERALSLVKWFTFVRPYSDSDFTIESDRMVALAGVVNMVASVLGSYYCGTWYQPSLTTEQNQFLCQILWQPSTQIGSRKANTLGGHPLVEGDRFIPTWSWASSYGVSYVPGAGPQRDRLTRLASPPPIGKMDRFGWPLAVEDATLHLVGVLVPIFVLPHTFYRWGFQAWARPLQDPLPSNGQLHGVMIMFDDAQEFAEVKEDAERSGGRRPLDGLFFLVTHYSEQIVANVCGLVVRVRDGKRHGDGKDRKEGIFSRAGVFFPQQCCGYSEEARFAAANHSTLFHDFQLARYGKRALDALELSPERRNLADAEPTLDEVYLR
ncbi:uncharacterized protein PgNI_09269 [Pyricularia grisea]|uniref:Heterokaryon incompatibility domain-containing protein n=1 Tax=Pyricularia grisea TaxID=148305 RepID=A0A6P8ASC1_PYRGI|nr:uncharacterized protein PgNI_09269 [Pyricularia grisea]TLD05008.1 hypothetical protein PgNI_09269 [Pyricularia grisea]